MEQNVSQINGEITINVDVNVKIIMYVKWIIFGILVHVVVETENFKQVLWMIQRLSVMKSHAKISPKNGNKETKNYSNKILMKKI